MKKQEKPAESDKDKKKMGWEKGLADLKGDGVLQNYKKWGFSHLMYMEA